MATILSSSPEASGSADPGQFCEDLVRKHDYESFLTSQFYPKEVRGGYFALKAFYVGVPLGLNVSQRAQIAFPIGVG